jgi:tripartite-type tricarboxylate transporter receptor subunit TctC
MPIKSGEAAQLVRWRKHNSRSADLLSGQMQVAFVPITSVIEYIRDGRLRPLAVTTAKRAELLPDVPALSEILSGYDATGCNGIGAPRAPRPLSSKSSTRRSTPLCSIPL